MTQHYPMTMPFDMEYPYTSMYPQVSSYNYSPPEYGTPLYLRSDPTPSYDFSTCLRVAPYL